MPLPISLRSGLAGAALALAAGALGCASPPKPAAPSPKPAPPAKAEPAPQKTAADPALQRDVERLIDQCERAKAAAAPGHVVDTEFDHVDKGAVIESWIVARGDSELVYTVRLAPGEAGTEIGISCPPKPRVK